MAATAHAASNICRAALFMLAGSIIPTIQQAAGRAQSVADIGPAATAIVALAEPAAALNILSPRPPTLTNPGGQGNG